MRVGRPPFRVVRAGLLVGAAVLLAALLATSARGVAGRPVPVLGALPPDGLTRALASGRIDEGRYVLERAVALFRPERVAARFGPLSRPGPRDATMILRDLAARLARLSPAERAVARSVLARPDEDAADASGQGYSVPAETPVCSTNFCFHWVSSTSDAPVLDDADADGVPDWVATTQAVLEQVWDTEVVQYGYRAPKPDTTSADPGPDGRLDVYLADVGDDGLYGYCSTDDPNTAGTGYQYFDASAYCVLDNDFSPSQFSYGASGLEALQVTAAHEFFHAIQFAYDLYEDRWLMEGSATWMEDQVFDDVNDNRQYLETSQLVRPDVSLDLAISDYADPRSGFQYGSWIFWRFLSESFGTPDVVREVWQAADGAEGGPDEYSIQAVDSMARSRGADVRSLVTAYAVANAIPAAFYEEGDSYPTPPVARQATLTAGRPTAAGQARLSHLASWYGLLRPGAGVRPGARVRVTLDLPPAARGSAASLLVVHRDGTAERLAFALNGKGDGTRTVPFGPGVVAGAYVVLTNASWRFACFHERPYSCQGQPRDDNLVFRYSARLAG